MARKIFIACVRGAVLAPICDALLAAQQKPDIRVDVDLVTVACAADTPGGTPAGNPELLAGIGPAAHGRPLSPKTPFTLPATVLTTSSAANAPQPRSARTY
jgi:hypothetical protein